jgi:hypothetical protein
MPKRIAPSAVKAQDSQPCSRATRQLKVAKSGSAPECNWPRSACSKTPSNVNRPSCWAVTAMSAVGPALATAMAMQMAPERPLKGCYG